MISLKTPKIPISEGVLFSAKSYFSDRFAPFSEKVMLPRYYLPSGEIEVDLSPLRQTLAPQNLTLKEKAASMLSSATSISGDPILIDVRHNSPNNWSHSLNFHIPFLKYLNAQLDDEPVHILNKATANHIQEIFKFFGLRTYLTNKPVMGRWIQYAQRPFNCLRCFASEWITRYIANEDYFQELCESKADTHSHVFLSRRGTRRISNEGEINQVLAQRGFVKKYAEDLDAIQQLRLFIHAEAIVAVHGAAIAPLLYRPMSKPTLKLVEIHNPGHMTDFYRGMAYQVGAKWVGVRGEIKSELVKESYDFRKRFDKFSLHDFRVDPESLLAAIDEIGI